MKLVVPTSAFAMKHQKITHLPPLGINCRRIYTKKIPLRQLTAAKQGNSAVIFYQTQKWEHQLSNHISVAILTTLCASSKPLRSRFFLNSHTLNL